MAIIPFLRLPPHYSLWVNVPVNHSLTRVNTRLRRAAHQRDAEGAGRQTEGPLRCGAGGPLEAEEGVAAVQDDQRCALSRLTLDHCFVARRSKLYGAAAKRKPAQGRLDGLSLRIKERLRAERLPRK